MMRRPHEEPRAYSRGRGSLLLELSIYLAIVGILGVPIALVCLRASRAYAEGDVLIGMLERNRTTLRRIELDFTQSLSGTASVTDAGKTLRFTLPGVFDGAASEPGDVIQFKIETDTGETANGVDDNGNGIVDEARVVRTNVTRNESVTIAASFDANASGFAANGGTVQVSLGTIGKAQGMEQATRMVNTMVMIPRN